MLIHEHLILAHTFRLLDRHALGTFQILHLTRVLQYLVVANLDCLGLLGKQSGQLFRTRFHFLTESLFSTLSYDKSLLLCTLLFNRLTERYNDLIETKVKIGTGRKIAGAEQCSPACAAASREPETERMFPLHFQKDSCAAF